MEEITLSLEKKQNILKNVEDLLQLYHDGSLGGEIMPEDANPGLGKGTKENYSYKLWGQQKLHILPLKPETYFRQNML